MSNFKDRLWRDLVREHGAELNEGNEPARPGLWMRPRLLLGSSAAGVAGVATAIAIALGTAGTSPAFAVTQNHDGSYTVQLLRASGIEGLNARLAQLGVRARAVDCYFARAGSGQVLTGAPGRAPNWTAAQAKIEPNAIPRGKFLEVPMGRVQFQAHGGAGHSADVVVASNAAGCEVPLPPPCAGPGAGAGWTQTGTSTTATGTGTDSTTTTGTDSTTTTGTGTTPAGGGSGSGPSPSWTITLAGSPAQVRAGVLVPATRCGGTVGYSVGPTGTSMAGTATTGTSTTASSAAPAQAIQK